MLAIGRAWNPVISVGIDFGTSYSGVAVAWAGDPTPRSYTIWPGQPIGYYKNLTYLLYEWPKESVIPIQRSWGFAARNKFAQIRAQALSEQGTITSEESFSYHRLTRFKLRLDKLKTAGDVIFKERHKEYSLEKVIADVLSGIWEFTVQNTPDIKNGTVAKNQIRWCLTVPEQWGDHAVALMRRAAFRAGLIEGQFVNNDKDGRLVTVSEPQAAALYLRRMDLSAKAALKPNARIMIFDAGGGTVDTTCYKVAGDGKLHQIGEENGDGCACGSTLIDDQFIRFFCETLGLPGPDELDKACPVGYWLFRDRWEGQKVIFEPHADASTLYFVDIPEELLTYLESQERAIDRLRKRQNNKTRSFRLNQSEMLSIFSNIVKMAVEVANNTLDNQMKKECDYVFVVGGFGQCETLREELRLSLGPRLIPLPGSSSPDPDKQIITPQLGASAIVMGAALFGLYPDEIPVRRSRATLAQLCYLPYDEEFDAGKIPVVVNGQRYCLEGLKVLVRRNELIDAYKPIAFDVTVRTPVRSVSGREFEHIAPVQFCFTARPYPRHQDPSDEPLRQEVVLIQFNPEGVGKVKIEARFDIENENNFIINIFDLSTNKLVAEIFQHLPTAFFSQELEK